MMYGIFLIALLSYKGELFSLYIKVLRISELNAEINLLVDTALIFMVKLIVNDCGAERNTGIFYHVCIKSMVRSEVSLLPIRWWYSVLPLDTNKSIISSIYYCSMCKDYI